MNFSFGMKQVFAHRKIKPLPDELLYILLRPAETMQNPRLFGFVFLPQGDDFVMTPHIVQNHRFFQGFRKFDLSLEKFNLFFKTRLVHLVQTCFTEGYDFWLLQVLSQFIQGFIHLKISLIQCPWMDAVTIVALIRAGVVQVQINNLD